MTIEFPKSRRNSRLDKPSEFPGRAIGCHPVGADRAAINQAPRIRRAVTFLGDAIGAAAIFVLLFAGLFVGSLMQ